MKKKGLFSHLRNRKVDMRHLSPKWRRLGDLSVLTLYKTVETGGGLTLRQFKTAAYKDIVAQNVALTMVLNGWCGREWSVVNAPKRRHRGWHFATEVSQAAACLTFTEYVDHFVKSHGNNRFKPCFVTVNRPKTSNVVCIDDILTTGATIKAMSKKLEGYNVKYIAIADNR